MENLAWFCLFLRTMWLKGENEVGSHSALGGCRTHFTLLSHLIFLSGLFPPFFLFFFGPKPSNLLSKASKAVVGHDPVQWVVAENWGEIQTGLVNRRSLKPAIKSFSFFLRFKIRPLILSEILKFAPKLDFAASGKFSLLSSF